MISWLSLAAWGSAAAIVVPVLIHLLSRQQPRVRPFPTLRWLAETPASRGRRPFPTEWLLLLLRCVLLVLLAAALAQPFWTGQSKQAPGWVLLAPEWTRRPLPDTHQARLDSLSRAGFEVRVLAPDYPLASAGAVAASEVSAWTLAEVAHRRAPADGAILIIPPTGAGAYRGIRPGLPVRVQWWAVAPPAPQAATQRRLRADSIWTVAWTPRGNQWDVSWVPSGRTTTRPRQAWVISNSPDDGRLWTAACKALRATGPPTWAVTTGQANALITGPVDVLVWWQPQPLPANIMAKLAPGGLVIRPADGPVKTLRSELGLWPGHATEVQFRQVTQPVGKYWTPVLQDEAGLAVAWQRPLGQAREVMLGWRFPSDATNLLEGARLPALLHRLVMDSIQEPGLDPRPMSVAESGPIPSSAMHAAQPADQRPAGVPLSPWVAIAAALLFGLERYLADRRSQSIAA